MNLEIISIVSEKTGIKEEYVKELQKRNLAKNSVNSARADYAYRKLTGKDAETALKCFEKKIGKEGVLHEA